MKDHMDFGLVDIIVSYKFTLFIIHKHTIGLLNLKNNPTS